MKRSIMLAVLISVFFGSLISSLNLYAKIPPSYYYFLFFEDSQEDSQEGEETIDNETNEEYENNILKTNIHNLRILDKQTRRVRLKEAKRIFSICINYVLGDGKNPICFNEFARGTMQTVTAYKILHDSSPKDKIFKNGILLKVLLYNLKIIETVAEKNPEQLTERIGVEIRKNAKKKIYEKNYDRIIYYKE